MTDEEMKIYEEDDKQREVVYVIRLNDCTININPTQCLPESDQLLHGKPNSYERLEYIFKTIQAYLRDLNGKQITIRDVSGEVEGKTRPVAFKFHILPPVDKGSSGVVSVPEDITPGKYNIALYIPQG